MVFKYFVISVLVSIQAVSQIGGQLTKEKEEKAKRDKELAKVVIRKEDVELIVCNNIMLLIEGE